MQAVSTAGAIVRRTLGAGLEALLIAAIVAALALSVAVASGSAPGAEAAFARGGSAIWISDASLRGTLSYGDSVAFGYQSQKAQSIQLQCFQPVGSSALVFATSQLVDGTAGVSEPFALGPSLAWDGGAASCRALLGHRSSSGKYVVDARVAFDVGD